MIFFGLWIGNEGRLFFRAMSAFIAFLFFFQVYFLLMVYYHIPENVMARFALSILGSFCLSFTIWWFSSPEKNSYLDIIFMGLLGGFVTGTLICLTVN
jgi:hypothetical protein